jgi:hypothetical protein
MNRIYKRFSILAIFILIISKNMEAAFLISNGGQASEGNYIGVYANGTSTLVGGYNDPSADNGHCAITSGPLTLIIPEQLSKFGLINTGCVYPNYSSKCTTLCDGVIVQGKLIENSESSSSTSSASTQTQQLQVSPLCQKIAAELINNFSDPNSTTFDIREYASCSPSDLSYCAVTFTPKNEDIRLRINTDYLLALGHISPTSCTVGSTAADALESEKQQASQAAANSQGIQSTCSLSSLNNKSGSCSFNISQSINDYIQNNLSAIQSATELSPAPEPPSGFFKCSDIEIEQAVLKKEAEKIYSNQLPELLGRRVYMATHRQCFYMPTSCNNLLCPCAQSKSGCAVPVCLDNISNPTAIDKRVNQEYENWLKKASPEEQKNFNKKVCEIYNSVESYISNEIKQYVGDGIPCVGTTTVDNEGNPIITYTCTSLGMNPNYTCNFIYTPVSGCEVNQSTGAIDCNMQLSSAYCSFEPSISFESPQLGGQDFECGFCGPAEMNTVGNNSIIQTGIESGAFNPATTDDKLYPYTTVTTPKPTCPYGFISNVGNVG